MTSRRETGAGVERRIRFGSEVIDFQVRFARRDRLRISVHPDQRVVVDAPAGKPLEEILDRVRSRGGWIVKQRQFFEQFMPMLPEKRYVGGETFYYLGRQYRLKIVAGEQQATKLAGRFLTVETPNKSDNRKIRAMVRHWYKTHARDTFERRMTGCHDVVRRYGIGRPRIMLRRMTRRWGSSSGTGALH